MREERSSVLNHGGMGHTKDNRGQIDSIGKMTQELSRDQEEEIRIVCMYFIFKCHEVD